MTTPSTADPRRSTAPSTESADATPTAAPGGPSTVPPTAPSAQDREEAARLLRRLTPREAQVLARLASGATPTQVAEALGIAPATARAHLTRAIRKLGVSNRAQALSLATHLDTAPAPPEDRTSTSTSAATVTAAAAAAPPVASVAGSVTGSVAGSVAPAPPPVDGAPPAAASPADSASPSSPVPASTPGPAPGPAPAPAPVPASSIGAGAPAGSAPVFAAEDRPYTFPALCAATHTRLAQQTFLLLGHRHRAVHCVRRALGDASRQWREVSALPDPEAWVRARAFDLALSPWRRGGPRRAHRLHVPRRRIKVRPIALGSLPTGAASTVPAVPTGAASTVPAVPTGAAGTVPAVPTGDPGPSPKRLTQHDRALLRALRRLSRPQRRALVLHDALGLPAAVVAREVESSTAAAAGRVLAARAALARAVPDLVGEDPYEPGFGERLGALLHRAAVHGCPAPRQPVPALLTTDSRIRSGVVTGAAGLLTLAMGTAVTTTLMGVGPSELFRPGEPGPAAVCTTPGSGSAGPLKPGGGAAGLRSDWCSPTPGYPVRFVTPPSVPAVPGEPAATDGPSAPVGSDGSDGTGQSPTAGPGTDGPGTSGPGTDGAGDGGASPDGGGVRPDGSTDQPGTRPTQPVQPTAPETGDVPPQAPAQAPEQTVPSGTVGAAAHPGSPAALADALLPVTVPCVVYRPCPTLVPATHLLDRLDVH